jgi:PAS domain S-box-containing protein
MRLSFIPFIILVALILIFRLTFDPTFFYEPAWLLPITNTIFVTLVLFIVAYIAIRNYRTTGRVQILLLGCGVLAFGIAAVVSGKLRSVPGTGANLNVTIYNTGALVGAAFHFIAALFLLIGVSPEVRVKRRALWLVFSYGGTAVFMGMFTIASLRGLIPPFFIQGVGPTVLRQGILGTADILFTFSFIIFMGSYLKDKESFLYWYALALALTALSLTAFFIQSSVGSLIGWAGRSAQYLGGLYFLISIIMSIRSAHARRISFDTVLTRSLSGEEEKFRALAENSPDIIKRFDREMRHLYVNPAGQRLYQKPVRSIIGKEIEETGLPEEYASFLKEKIREVFETSQPVEAGHVLSNEKGIRFYQSHCVPEYDVDGKVTHVLMISRDLTEQKQMEEALRQSEKSLRAVTDNSPDAIYLKDRENRLLMGNPTVLRILGRTVEQSLGKTDLELYADPAIGRAIQENDRRIMDSGQAATVEEFVDTPDGRRIFLSTKAPWRDAQGNTIGIIGISRDITERKLMEESLKESEERQRLIAQKLAKIFHSAPSFYSLTTFEKGRYLEVNPAFEKIYGYEKEELIGRTVFELNIWADFNDRQRVMTRLQDTGSVSGEEVRVRTKSGQIRTIILSCESIEIDGQLCVITSGMDITERKRSEEALRNNERLLQEIIDGSPSTVFLKELDGRFITANRSLEELVGISREKLKGKTDYDIFKKEEADQFKANDQRVIEEGKPIQFEETFELASGKRHVFLVNKFPLFNSLGQPYGICGISHEITDRKQMEEDLRRSRDELEVRVQERTGELRSASVYARNLIEASLDPLVTINRDGKITDVNRATELATGLPRGTLIGSDFSDHFTEPEKAREGYKQVFSKGSVTDYPLAIRHTSGRVLEVLYHAAVYNNEAGEVQGVFAAARDITERNRTEEALRKSEEQLRLLSTQLLFAQETERKRIAAELHDSICASLAVVKMNLEKKLDQMKKGISTSEVKLEDIVSAVQSCNEETRKIMNNLRPGMLDDLGVLPTLNWHLREFRTMNPHITIQKEIHLLEEDLPDSIKIAVYRVIQEALNNVVKHSRADTVRISLKKEDNQIKMIIQDNGQGFNLEKATAEKSGMGLINMRERVQWSGGSFSLQSSEGQGTTMLASWTISQGLSSSSVESKSEIKEWSRMVANSRAAEKRVIKTLIVEDNNAFRQSIKESLLAVSPDMDIQEVEEGGKCMEKVDVFLPELIFMDIRLPGENGLSLTKKIKAKYPEIEVVVMTSYDNPEYQDAALQLGARQFYSKDLLNLEEIKALLTSIGPVN